MPRVGTYVRQPAGFKAFVLAPFPPKELIRWNDSLINLLSRANLALGGLRDITRLVPNVDFFIFMYANKEAVQSSQIEGTQATLVDYVKAQADMREDLPSDVDEIGNYIAAMNHGLTRLEKLPISGRLIGEIHELLLQGVRGQHRTPGAVRTTQNWIGGSSIETATFVPPPVLEMQRALGEFEKFVHAKDEVPILVRAGLLHAQFETIHPYLDGNGRTGRLLVTFFLCQAGVLPKPLLYLSAFFRRHRTAYYDKLNDYRFKEDGVEAWLYFFLEGVRVVSEEALVTAERITELRERHIRAVSAFGKSSPRALKLLDYLYAHPVVDAKVVMKVAAVTSKVTANALLSRMQKGGILHEITGRMRSRKYLYRDYVRLFE